MFLTFFWFYCDTFYFGMKQFLYQWDVFFPRGIFFCLVRLSLFPWGFLFFGKRLFLSLWELLFRKFFYSKWKNLVNRTRTIWHAMHLMLSVVRKTKRKKPRNENVSETFIKEKKTILHLSYYKKISISWIIYLITFSQCIYILLETLQDNSFNFFFFFFFESRIQVDYC